MTNTHTNAMVENQWNFNRKNINQFHTRLHLSWRKMLNVQSDWHINNVENVWMVSMETRRSRVIYYTAKQNGKLNYSNENNNERLLKAYWWTCNPWLLLMLWGYRRSKEGHPYYWIQTLFRLERVNLMSQKSIKNKYKKKKWIFTIFHQNPLTGRAYTDRKDKNRL